VRSVVDPLYMILRVPPKSSFKQLLLRTPVWQTYVMNSTKYSEGPSEIDSKVILIGHEILELLCPLVRSFYKFEKMIIADFFKVLVGLKKVMRPHFVLIPNYIEQAAMK
jgi:hypothetical protein